MNNYEFCAAYIEGLFPEKGVKLLDYGCGAGHIVQLLRRAGFDAYGCDQFYEGGDRTNEVAEELRGSYVLRMEGNRIPFPDGAFDLVLSNQVLEHVADLDIVLAETRRVLKPGGQVLSLFPDAGVWREGHCGIPFLHWFPKRSGRMRTWYALAGRSLGLGLHKDDKPRSVWAADFCNWLDAWCYYRSYAEIAADFGRHFGPIEHIESEYLDARYPAARNLPRGLKAFIVRKLAGNVFVCRRPATEAIRTSRPRAANQLPRSGVAVGSIQSQRERLKSRTLGTQPFT